MSPMRPPAGPDNERSPGRENFTCGKGCKLFLVLMVALLALVWLMYEPNPTSANMCHVYG
ncbi:hypothetical protein DBV39_00745 [Orrella marina]|uniref:Uncharacterized protein n=1 Tax=Orrella marina TaxID=2163011 RepID=A0A2R4XFB2_9BURK|nr:hypothetical protein DBV39_00745 [Orrella marina]